MSKTPGTFTNHGTGAKYEAVSRAHHRVNTEASKIADAISNGKLPVHLVSGCRAVMVADLLKIREVASNEA